MSKYTDADVERALELIRNNEYFIHCLDEFNTKYTHALKYTVKPNSDEAIEYTYRIRGVREFVTNILRPLASEENTEVNE